MYEIFKLPKDKKSRRPRLNKRYLVEYDLIYEDGGRGEFSKSFRFKSLAKLSIFKNYYISSYGGTVKMFDQS